MSVSWREGEVRTLRSQDRVSIKDGRPESYILFIFMSGPDWWMKSDNQNVRGFDKAQLRKVLS